jgi:antitoxin (DNA-binding transcriptional repressor) of toxin-antitoxin stability system
MRVDVGQAQIDLPKLLAWTEAGIDVEITRDGVPVAGLVRIDRTVSPGSRFLASHGSLAGTIRIGANFEFTEPELDAMLEG